MALIRLRRKIFPNNSGIGAPFFAQVIYFDTDTRKPYPTQLDSTLNDPFELAKDALVTSYQVRAGLIHDVRYNGNGSVYTKSRAGNLGNATAGLRLLAGLLPLYTSNPGAADACVDLTGTMGLPPYRIQLLGTGGAANGYSQASTSPSELYPARFYNLREGQYLASVTDATNAVASQLLTITAGNSYGRAALVYELAPSPVTRVITYQWRYNERDMHRYEYAPKQQISTYYAPYGTLLDGFLTNNGATLRRVYSSGRSTVNGNDPASIAGLVYFEDTSTLEASELELDNLILFHPDTPQEQNGGVLVEMRASHPPLTYTLRASRIPIASNQTGHFDGLASGSYTVQVEDRLGKSVTVPVALEDRYGKRWVLAYSEISGIPLRLELWTLGYTGAVEAIFGQEHPVVIKTDGLNTTLGGQGDIGPVVGTSAQLNLKVTHEIFEEVIGRDRYCRADFYYDNQLYFRGFVDPSTYDAPMLPGLQPITVLATDGLGALKEIEMSDHVGQRLYGRRPWLNTLLHCLSRTDIALPLRLFTNRRDATMATADAPELLATTDRTGYWDQEKNEPWLLRKVLEGLAQAAGGTLCQRGGAWQVRNILEAATDAAGRAYRPAGTEAGLLTAAAPADTILPPTQGPIHWLERSQVKQVRAGWKSLTGKTDVGYLKNAYPQGGVFSDKYAWLDDASQLRATSGWRPAVGQQFPLIFSRLGDKGDAYTTQWLRSTNLSRLDGRYLQGPPLPLAAGGEAVPATLELTGRFASIDYWLDNVGASFSAPTNATKCVLSYELVIGGRGAGVQMAEFELAKDGAKDGVVSIPLPTLPSATPSAEIRVYAWYAADTNALANALPVSVLGNINQFIFAKGTLVYYDFGTGVSRLFIARLDNAPSAVFGGPNYLDWFWELPATNAGQGQFYLSSVGVKLTPQNATWEGEDNFRADGVAGTIRPTEPLEVIHPDVPLAAGLYGGNLPAFSLGVALVDGTMSTSWQRSIDKDASPLFESNVYDGLALRDGASRLLLGTLDHRGALPPLLLDTFDAPFEEAGVAAHRFAVCSTEWNTKLGRTEVSLVQNGPGAGAQNPYSGYSGKILIADTLYQYLPGLFVPHALGASDGSLLSWE